MDNSVETLRFIAANPERKAEYRIDKRVQLRRGRKVFVKTAASEASRPFLRTIYEREQFALSQFNGSLKVVAAESIGDELIYPFVEQPTLADQIQGALQKGTPDLALDWLQRYHRILFSMPRVECVPADFYNYLGWQSSELERPVQCVAFGPLDTIPKNILVNGADYTVLDLEWTFSFPIPAQYLFWRGLSSLTTDFQQEIQHAASPQSPVILYCGYGFHREYVPLKWYETFMVAMDVAKFLQWESLFYLKVLDGPQRSTSLRLTAGKPFTTFPRKTSLPTLAEECTKRLVKRARTILN